MGRKVKHPEHVNHERWLVSYADFVTLLFAFFVVMFAVGQTDTKKVKSFSESFSGAVTWNMFDEAGKGMMPAETPGKAGDNDDKKKREKHEEKALARDFKSALAGKIKANPDLAELRVIESHDEIILRLPERLLFDTGAADMRAEGRDALVAIANELTKHDVTVRVEGHADAAPIHTERFPSNWELSGARAMGVLRVLLETKKIGPDRLSAAGYGEHHPIASNETVEGRAQNRRVDLVIVLANDP